MFQLNPDIADGLMVTADQATDLSVGSGCVF